MNFKGMRKGGVYTPSCYKMGELIERVLKDFGEEEDSL